MIPREMLSPPGARWSESEPEDRSVATLITGAMLLPHEPHETQTDADTIVFVYVFWAVL